MDGSVRPTLSRRRLLTAGAALAGATLLTGCGSSAPAGSTSVREWNLFSGGDGDRFVEMQDGFRAQTPGTFLSAITLPWGAPFYTKLALAATGGRRAGAAPMSRRCT